MTRARLEKLSPILLTRNVATAAAFWGRLGFHVVYQDDSYLLMKRDAAEVHFTRSATLDPARNECCAYLRMDDLRALDSEWGALGLPIDGIPRFERMERKPWHMWEAALVDEDGNLVRAGIEA